MQRNITLDYYKIALSILVISIHIQSLFSVDSLLGWFISNGIARIAVPSFFLISGYYLYDKMGDRMVVKKYLLHLLVIYIVWMAIYAPLYYDLEPGSIIAIVIMGYYHLWFIPALILSVALIALFRQFVKKGNVFVVIALILYLIGYLLEKVYPELDVRLVRNGLFMGFPFVAIGYYMKERKTDIHAKTAYTMLIALIAIAILLVESYINYRGNHYPDFYLSLPLLCPALLVLILKKSEYGGQNEYVTKLAAGIYYIHVMVLTVIIPVSETNNIYLYPFIAVESIILSLIVIFVNKRIKIFL